MKIIAAATAVLFTAQAAFALDTCDKDARVLTSDGVAGIIVGGPVSGMCIVALADGNMTPVNLSDLTPDTSEPPATDIRSIVPGIYGCQQAGQQTNDIALEIEVIEGNRYAIPNEGDGAWEAYDALSIHFLDGPLAGRFGDGQNGVISVSRSNDAPRLQCKVRD